MIYTVGGDEAEYGNFSKYENLLRRELQRLVGAPLALHLVYEGTGIAGDSNISYDDEKTYSAIFLTPDESLQFTASLDVETGEALFVWRIDLTDGLAFSDLHMNPFDGKWLAVAQDAVTAIRGDDAAIVSAQCLGETKLQDAVRAVPAYRFQNCFISAADGTLLQ